MEHGRRAAGRAPTALRGRERRHRGAARRAAGTRSAPRARPTRPQHLQVVQNWGAQAGARTNHLCFDLYDLPQIPHRIAEELGGAARFLIREGECPYCRLVREEVRRPDHLLYEDDHAVAFAPYASRSPFEVWVVPRAHDADFARATDRDIAATGEALRQVLGRLAASLDNPPYNLVLHTAPLKEQVDATYHWHWEIHPRLREIAGLELGTGSRSTRSPPRTRSRSSARDGGATDRRSTRAGDGGGGRRPSHDARAASSQRLGAQGSGSGGHTDRQRSTRGRGFRRA